MKGSWSVPGADIDSDHNLVAMRITVQLRKIQARKRRNRWDLEGIRANTGCLETYREDVEMKLEMAAQGYQDVKEQWQI